MPSIGPTTGSKPDKLGPYSKVTPTNRAGDSNADDAPQIVSPTVARSSADARRADIQQQQLLTMRAILRVLIEGFGLPEDPEMLTTDEDFLLGPDANS